jgi:hypothetical protein
MRLLKEYQHRRGLRLLYVLEPAWIV